MRHGRRLGGRHHLHEVHVRTTTRSASSVSGRPPNRGQPPNRGRPPPDTGHRSEATGATAVRTTSTRSTSRQDRQPATTPATTPPAGIRTSEGIATGHDAPQGRLEPQGGSAWVRPSTRSASGPPAAISRRIVIRGHHQDHHQQVQSQDHHQAVRMPPGPRHGWRSGIAPPPAGDAPQGRLSRRRRSPGPRVSQPDPGGHPPDRTGQKRMRLNE